MSEPPIPPGLPELFELPRERAEIAPGAVHVPGWLSLQQQRELLDRCREWARGPVPLRHAVLPGGGRMSVRSVSLGWDWESIDGVWEKVAEELEELRAADGAEDRLHELGDVVFALVNLARWMKLDPEEALRAANHRWMARYRRVEALAAERGIDLAGLTLAEKDVLWDEVKAG